jgi:hypothetical protein
MALSGRLLLVWSTLVALPAVHVEGLIAAVLRGVVVAG